MIVLSCTNITKTFGIDPILTNISFGLNAGDRVGLIGRNGAGKSTLFNILTGKLHADSGDIFIAKDHALGYLEQAPTFNSTDTLYDFCLPVFQELIDLENKMRETEHVIAEAGANVSQKMLDDYATMLEDFEGRNGYGYRSEIRGVLKGLGFTDQNMDQPVMQFSGGQKSRVNIAKLLLRQPDVLLLDEPTNHLDIDSIKWLEQYLSSYPGTLVLITHDRYFLDQVVNRVFELEGQKLLAHTGTYSEFMTFKRDQYDQQLRAYEKQQKEIARQEEMISRFKQHGTELLAKRARSREKRLAQVDVIDRPTWLQERTKIRLTTQVQSGEDILFATDLSKAWTDTPIFEHADLSIYRHDRIGLIGPNGVGKTTLFRILLDQETASSGQIKWGHNVFPGYYDQEQSNLTDDLTLVEEINEANPKLSVPEIRGLLGAFLFRGDDVFKTIGNLSGGEKGRVSLLKLMLSKSNFLLMDEPTNHLDIPSKEALEDALLHYDGTLMAISHDRYFLNKICSRIFELTPEGIVIYHGNYDYYQEKIKEAQQAASAPAQVEMTKTRLRDKRKQEKEKAAALKKQKQYLQSLETEISEVEMEIESLDEEMCDPAVYSDPEKSKKIHQAKAELEDRLAHLYEEWEGHADT